LCGCIAAELGFDLRERVSDDPEALLPTAIMQPATFAMNIPGATVMSHGTCSRR
jgi:hypothetical protein